MPKRRTSTLRLALLALVIAALIAACAPPAVPTVEITSHDDGQRVFGPRTIAVTGTATNTAQVQIVQNGTIVATVAVDLVFPWVDATTFRPMDVVIGQPDKTSNTGGTSATQTSSNTHGTPTFVDGILYVPDANNHRVLGFIGLPTEDGADACNARILVYNTLPTTNFAPADVVIGQSSMTTSDYTFCSLDAPFEYLERLAVGGGKLVVPEYSGHRVLIWNSIPTENGTEPDLVLGQPGSGATCINDDDDDQDGVQDAGPSARTVGRSYGVWMGEGAMIVNDFGNARFALYVD